MPPSVLAPQHSGPNAAASATSSGRLLYVNGLTLDLDGPPVFYNEMPPPTTDASAIRGAASASPTEEHVQPSPASASPIMVNAQQQDYYHPLQLAPSPYAVVGNGSGTSPALSLDGPGPGASVTPAVAATQGANYLTSYGLQQPGMFVSTGHVQQSLMLPPTPQPHPPLYGAAYGQGYATHYAPTAQPFSSHYAPQYYATQSFPGSYASYNPGAFPGQPYGASSVSSSGCLAPPPSFGYLSSTAAPFLGVPPQGHAPAALVPMSHMAAGYSSIAYGAPAAGPAAPVPSTGGPSNTVAPRSYVPVVVVSPHDGATGNGVTNGRGHDAPPAKRPACGDRGADEAHFLAPDASPSAVASKEQASLPPQYVTHDPLEAGDDDSGKEMRDHEDLRERRERAALHSGALFACDDGQQRLFLS